MKTSNVRKFPGRPWKKKNTTYIKINGCQDDHFANQFNQIYFEIEVF